MDNSKIIPPTTDILYKKTVCVLYLGAPKKPPLSVPRQDRATRNGMRGATPWRARLANVCRFTILQRATINSSRFSLINVGFFVTDHSYSVRQQQLSRAHHGVVGHVDEHIKDCYCHHGADDCHWNRSGRTWGDEIASKLLKNIEMGTQS